MGKGRMEGDESTFPSKWIAGNLGSKLVDKTALLCYSVNCHQNKLARSVNNEQMGRLLTLEEAAERLRISKHTLYNWLQNGKNGIREYAFKMGDKKWVFKEEDLERFIESQRNKRS